MKQSSTYNMICLASLLFTFFGCVGCNPLYVIEAGYQQSRILCARRPLETVIADPRTTNMEREKLKLVTAARKFAPSLGLVLDGAYSSYADIKRSELAWILVATRPDSFSMYTWWFPIVGHVPYKGFFTRNDGEQAAKELINEGYEVWLRPTDAFSTLGWFNDPLLSTTLRHRPVQIVNILLHESTHSTLWLPDHVKFNETLANFVGLQGTIEFFESRVTDQATHAVAQSLEAHAMLKRELLLSHAIGSLYQDLERLYQSDRSSTHKLIERSKLFSKHISPLHSQLPGLTILQQPNNAELIQLKLYLTELDQFDRLYRQSGSWSKFWKSLRNITNTCHHKATCDPFSLLRAKIYI